MVEETGGDDGGFADGIELVVVTTSADPGSVGDVEVWSGVDDDGI